MVEEGNNVTGIPRLAEKALLYEVSLSPKPGLVDRWSNGAHRDMDFFLFIDSISSLSPYFTDYFQQGYQHQGTLEELFEQERVIGIRAEKAMLAATHGINTHKGANFSFALLLGAAGYCCQQGSRLPFSAADTNQLLQVVAKMSQELVQKDFQHLDKKSVLSYGEELYLKKGMTGIRGEAQLGYPALRELVLPFLRTTAGEMLDKEERLLRLLLLLMSKVEDSNILHRGTYEDWLQVKEEAKDIHQQQLTKAELVNVLVSYDRCLTARYLSPGGSADLLALGIFLGLLENLL